jgi:hypothetical protein
MSEKSKCLICKKTEIDDVLLHKIGTVSWICHNCLWNAIVLYRDHLKKKKK